MKAREIAIAVAGSGLFYGLTTFLPVWAALFVVVPFMILLGLSAIGDARDRRHA